MSYIKALVASLLLFAVGAPTVSFHQLVAASKKRGQKKGAKKLNPKKQKALKKLNEKIAEIRSAGFTKEGFDVSVKILHALAKRAIKKGGGKGKAGKKGGGRKGKKAAGRKGKKAASKKAVESSLEE